MPTITGGVKVAVPQFPLFLNEATDSSVIQAVQRYDSAGNPIGGSIPLTPIVPTVSGLTFTGNHSGNTSYIGSAAVGSFGNFSFTSNVIANYEIVISRDGVNFDPTLPSNRSLRGIMTASSPSIPWDGKDNNGNYFPVGTNYPTRVTVKAGEYHFPVLDAENNLGGVTITLKNAISPFGNNNQGFFDDRSYKTIGGTLVGSYNNTTQTYNTLAGTAPPIQHLALRSDTVVLGSPRADLIQRPMLAPIVMLLVVGLATKRDLIYGLISPVRPVSTPSISSPPRPSYPWSNASRRSKPPHLPD